MGLPRIFHILCHSYNYTTVGSRIIDQFYIVKVAEKRAHRKTIIIHDNTIKTTFNAKKWDKKDI